MHLPTRTVPALALVATLATVLTPDPAAAAPRLIDEACAQAGCFAGDLPGLPVTINEPGSYRLASNLEHRGTSLSVIDINAPYVQLDLDGFAILGENRCEWTGERTACEEHSTLGAGVLAGHEAAGVTIRNGTIAGMPGNGIEILGPAARVIDLTVREVGRDGIAVRRSGLVRDSVVELARYGFSVASGSLQPLFSRCSARFTESGFLFGTVDNVVNHESNDTIRSWIIDGSNDRGTVVVP